MMLCKADFKDVFPDIFPSEAAPHEPERSDKHAISHQNAPVIPGFANAWPASMMIGAGLASASMVAANQAVWNLPRRIGAR